VDLAPQPGPGIGVLIEESAGVGFAGCLNHQHRTDRLPVRILERTGHKVVIDMGLDMGEVRADQPRADFRTIRSIDRVNAIKRHYPTSTRSISSPA